MVGRGVGYAASPSRTSGSKADRMVAAVFWIRSQDALIAGMDCSPPPAHVATYPKEWAGALVAPRAVVTSGGVPGSTSVLGAAFPVQ
jgi:hypothetical protein